MSEPYVRDAMSPALSAPRMRCARLIVALAMAGALGCSDSKERAPSDVDGGALDAHTLELDAAEAGDAPTTDTLAPRVDAGMCISGPENTPPLCSDGCSNDGDLYVDCDDRDCCDVVSGCDATTYCGGMRDAGARDDALPPSDAGSDAPPRDAGSDAGHDAGMDAGTDAGADAGHDSARDAGPLLPTRARYPWNGLSTGSPHVSPGAAIVDHPLRPKLMWEPVSGATHYQVQLTSECSVLGFRSCSFTSPTVDTTTTLTTFRPASALPVSATRPVGRRYYWRVRACNAGVECSAWTEVRYLNVGRSDKDFDGDGYADAIVGALGYESGATAEGNAFVFYGTSTGLPSIPSATLDNPANQERGYFGRSVAALGDVNGDGYADAIVGADSQYNGATDEGNAFVYYGTSAGLPPTPDVTLDNPANQAAGSFGCSVAGLGDVNGDGYADAMVGAARQDSGAEDEGNAFVYYGTSGGLPSTPDVTLDNPTNQPEGRFGYSIAGLGDVDGDGYADAIVCAPAQSNGASREGNAFVYYGTSAGLPSTPDVTLDNPANEPGGFFGSAVGGVGDVNGDGYADAIVGASYQDRGRIDEGNAFVYYGASAGLPPTPSVILDNPANRSYGIFGSSVAGMGDVNGDGYADAMVGAALQDNGATDEGNAFVYYGTSAGLASTPNVTLDNPANQPSGYFGNAVAGVGDVNGDGYADAMVGAYFQDSGAENEGNAFMYYGTSTGLSSTPDVTLDSPANKFGGYFGNALARLGHVERDAYAGSILCASLCSSSLS